MVLSNIRSRKSSLQPGSISKLSTFHVICLLSKEISRIDMSYFVFVMRLQFLGLLNQYYEKWFVLQLAVQQQVRQK